MKLKKFLPYITGLVIATIIAIMNVSFIATAGNYNGPVQAACGNSYATSEDGLYSACKDDSIFHAGSEINIEVANVSESSVKLELEGAKKVDHIKLPLGGSLTVTAENELYNVTMKFTEYDPIYGAFIEIDSEFLMSCGDSEGSDGLYVFCNGDSVYHTTSGIEATVEWYNDEMIKLTLDGALEDELYIKPNQQKFIYDEQAGYGEVYFIYRTYPGDSRAYLEIAS